MMNENQKPRPPIVVVVGHVDHGKTTLLDYIRKTNVAGREAGGITQSIGAYEIWHANSAPPPEGSGNANAPIRMGRRITFIDTPGHEAFVKMRAAGAEVADLAILVVAADDGVKPQTKEAIDILNKTKTPFVVAINKIDKPEANIEKVKNELMAAGVLLEGYGGQVSYHGISSKTGDGVNELLDLILLATDVEHLAWDPHAPGTGFILETRRDSRRGLEVITIVKDGVLAFGDYIATPTANGKIKILEDCIGRRAERLEPSSPAVIVGFETPPKVGEEFRTAHTKELLGAPVLREAKRPLPAPQTAPSQAEGGELRVILKAEDAGSLEALSMIMRNFETKKTINVLSESIGDITDGDVKFAIPSRAVIVGFKVKPSAAAKNLAQANHIPLITSAVVYELVKAVEDFLRAPAGGAMIGELEILAVFNQKKLERQLVGGKVVGGAFRNKAAFEIKRGEETVGQGKTLNLQSQRKDVNEAASGNDAGLLVSSSVPISVGDRLVIKR